MNKIILFASLATTFIHGMETVSLLGMTKTSLNMVYNGTKINLSKKPWEDAVDTKVLMVIGNQQQNMLQERHNGLNTIGHAYFSYGTVCYIRKRKMADESASDDDTYIEEALSFKSYRQIDKQTWREHYKEKKIYMKIEEPCISNSTREKIISFCQPDSDSMQTITIPAQLMNTFVYNVHRAVPDRDDAYYDLVFQGDEAIQEASKDLILCYNNALTEGLKYFQSEAKKNRSLTFPTLGADTGFPRDKAAPIAIATVFEFIQEHPDEYESITFFVKKRSDFALYKKLLMEYYKPIQTICLLYFAHKNNETIISLLPFNVINHITWLMHNS